MKSTKMQIVTTQTEEIFNCPYCGSVPEVTVSVEKKLTDTISHITHTEVCCTACGLSAPISVWQHLSENIEEKICKEGD